MQKELIYTLYERFWHWFQAVMILTLLFTGFSVHYSGSAGVIPFATAVRLHNVVGWLLVINAFLGFFYYLTTGTLRQLIPEPREL
ncbi:MAG: cytochrome b/b6 domain-containing protein, partial [Thermogutta sp.]|uniref:cytochrome b/b6 domain-containing protein n=1 Tax=Thermogutta sp. TaxID=1962930 RepID=UPI0019B1A9D8